MISREEAKQIQGDVMSLGRKYSKDLGSSNGLAKGTMEDAVKRTWETRYKQTHPSFEQWKKEVWSDFTERNAKRNKKQISLFPEKEEKMTTENSQPVIVSSRGYQLKYELYITKLNLVPTDDFMANLLGIDKKAVGKIRSKLMQLGYKFQNVVGGYLITQRPTVVIKPAQHEVTEPEPKVEPKVESKPQEESLETQPTFELLESTPDPMLKNIESLLIHIGNKLDRQFELDQRMLNALNTMVEEWK